MVFSTPFWTSTSLLHQCFSSSVIKYSGCQCQIVELLRHRLSAIFLNLYDEFISRILPECLGERIFFFYTIYIHTNALICVAIFITFRSLYHPAFTRFMSNLGTYMKIQTEPFTYKGILFLFLFPRLGIFHLVLILCTAQLLLAMFLLRSITLFPAQCLNSQLLSRQIHQPRLFLNLVP